MKTNRSMYKIFLSSSFISIQEPWFLTFTAKIYEVWNTASWHGFLQRSSVDVLALVNVEKINENEKIRSTWARGGDIKPFWEAFQEEKKKRRKKLEKKVIQIRHGKDLKLLETLYYPYHWNNHYQHLALQGLFGRNTPP